MSVDLKPALSQVGHVDRVVRGHDDEPASPQTQGLVGADVPQALVERERVFGEGAERAERLFGEPRVDRLNSLTEGGHVCIGCNQSGQRSVWFEQEKLGSFEVFPTSNREIRVLQKVLGVSFKCANDRCRQLGGTDERNEGIVGNEVQRRRGTKAGRSGVSFSAHIPNLICRIRRRLDLLQLGSPQLSPYPKIGVSAHGESRPHTKVRDFATVRDKNGNNGFASLCRNNRSCRRAR